MDKLIECNHVPICYGRLDHHTAYDDPPGIQHKLPWGDIQVINELHNEWMDGQSETTQECRFIKADFTMGKGTSLLTLPRKTSPRLVKELEPISKLVTNFNFQGTFLLEGMKRTRSRRNRRIGGRRFRNRHGSGCICSSPIHAHIRRRAPLRTA